MYLDLVGLRHQSLQVRAQQLVIVCILFPKNKFIIVNIFLFPFNYLKFITGGVADPFTGSGAYSSQPMEVDSIEDASQYFPQTTYLQFTQVF